MTDGDRYDEHRDPEAWALDLGIAPPPPPLDLAWPQESAGIGLPAGRLEGFATSLFVQARHNEARDTARLIEHTGVGAVFTLDHRREKLSPLQRGLRAVDLTRGRHVGADILIDFGAYAGPKRKVASDGLSRQWVQDQHIHMRLPWALTDSGFCDTVQDVQRTLRDARPFHGCVIVALPMPHALLRDSPRDLLDLINNQAHPVALMLEHESDPFEVAGVVEGLIDVVTRSAPGAMLLRSDTSALGAISHGALAGAVGTHSGLRHIYPRRSGGGRSEQLAFVVPSLLTYYSQVRFEQAYFRDPALASWICSCWFCTGRDLSWIAGQPEDLLFRSAFQHSVAAVAAIGSRLVGTSTIDIAAAWGTLCRHAQGQHSLLSNPSGSAWQPKRALEHWGRLVPTSR